MGYGMKYTKGGFPFKTDPTKKAKKSITTAHGQLKDANKEYEAELKLLKGDKLKDLRSSDKNVDLDKGADMPIKRSGFGPRTSFGGSKNPELR